MRPCNVKPERVKANTISGGTPTYKNMVLYYYTIQQARNLFLPAITPPLDNRTIPPVTHSSFYNPFKHIKINYLGSLGHIFVYGSISLWSRLFYIFSMAVTNLLSVCVCVCVASIEICPFRCSTIRIENGIAMDSG